MDDETDHIARNVTWKELLAADAQLEHMSKQMATQSGFYNTREKFNGRSPEQRRRGSQVSYKESDVVSTPIQKKARKSSQSIFKSASAANFARSNKDEKMLMPD